MKKDTSIMYKGIRLMPGSECHRLHTEGKIKELDKLLKEIDRKFKELLEGK